MGGMSGKHNPDSVLMGIHTKPEVKALAKMVAEADGNTLTVEVETLFYRRARELGIINDDNTIRPKVAEKIIAGAAGVRVLKSIRQNRIGAKKQGGAV